MPSRPASRCAGSGGVHGELVARGSESNALRKRSRKALIGQTGACGFGRRPSCQPHPAIRCSTAGSWAMIEIGTSWLAPCPVTIVRGLVVAQDDQHEVLVAVVLHERDDRAQRVLDRLAVGRA